MCFVLFLDFLSVVVIICGHHFWWSSFGGHYPNLLSPTTSCFGWWPWSFFAQMGKPMVIKVSKTLVKWWPYDDHVVIIWKWWPWAFWWSSYGHHMMTMVIILKWWPPWGPWSSFLDNAHQNAHHIPFGQVWSLLIFSTVRHFSNAHAHPCLKNCAKHRKTLKKLTKHPARIPLPPPKPPTKEKMEK